MNLLKKMLFLHFEGQRRKAWGGRHRDSETVKEIQRDCEWEREREGEKSSCQPVYFPNAYSLARALPGQYQEPRTQCRFFTWLAGLQVLEPTWPAFWDVHSQKAGSETEAGLDPLCHNVHSTFCTYLWWRNTQTLTHNTHTHKYQ